MSIIALGIVGRRGPGSGLVLGRCRRLLLLLPERLQIERRQQWKVEASGETRGLLEIGDVLQRLQEGGRVFLGLASQFGHAGGALITATR